MLASPCMGENRTRRQWFSVIDLLRFIIFSRISYPLCYSDVGFNLMIFGNIYKFAFKIVRGIRNFSTLLAFMLLIEFNDHSCHSHIFWECQEKWYCRRYFRFSIWWPLTLLGLAWNTKKSNKYWSKQAFRGLCKHLAYDGFDNRRKIESCIKHSNAVVGQKMWRTIQKYIQISMYTY